ncbi:MAG: S8 family serine peptidase, partial [Acidobacteriota bacterium]|nr:S8 family serine peptidase [Acidobacteriota bacterium]
LVELRAPGEKPGAVFARGECLNLIRALEKRAAATLLPPLHSLTAYWRLDLRDHPDLADEVVARLARLAEVDLAYRELRADDPQLAGSADGHAFAEDQGYLDDAPLGIGASWAWKRLAGTVSQVTVCDLEQGWNLGHNDLAPLGLHDPVYGANRTHDDASPGHHGTAVLGQLAAPGTNSLGVRGADAQLGRFILTSHYRGKAEAFFPGTNGHVAAAIVQTLVPPAQPALKGGDVLLLEVQRGLLPTEVDEADFDAIRLASALHVSVVEAAGNGGFDLDRWIDPDTGRSLRRGGSDFRDSGAILVGAARAGLPHDRASYSNYGSRVDCFSWGEAVTTCGFGDLAGTGAADFYTNRFDGTSSASPVIAGAAALLQSLHQAQTAGTLLEPWEMRALLGDPATGTPQGPNVAGRIGVMPDLEAIIRDALQLVPDIYMRRSLGDGGSPPAPGDEISSSPDTLVWNGPQAAAVHFGEGSLREDLAAPGSPIQAGQANPLYVRLRNRGMGAGDVQVQLFASPAATLVTPERWIPVGSITGNQIPQGDTLSVAGPLPWSPGSPDLFWSFLAVLSTPGEGPPGPPSPPYFDWAVGLPPGPPYFDWAEFRAFLRRPGVAWRNTHRIAASASLTLPFVIAGTPDQGRAFDFEVLQRLPEKAAVTLQVPPALAAKLRQRRSWSGGTSGNLILPQKPLTAFNQVGLATGARVAAAFLVAADPGHPLTPGHSLALRQLWHGEEVGRITWFFGLAP